jgi:cytochrome c556
MDGNGGAVGLLGGMAKGEKEFDAAAAEAAKQTLIANAAGIAAAFTNNASDPEAHAKPEVWTNWDDFVAKAGALGTAAAALDASSLDGIKAGLGAIGGACKDCHTTYKAS